MLSKWIGETEQNLAEVFDAAEDGQVVILFDEADSLFAKRTEVKSSVDRYANLEVNYLLQRLDTFEGIAILTTNFGGGDRPAFKRRLSLRLHLPVPRRGDARAAVALRTSRPRCRAPATSTSPSSPQRYRLSGGYIRNAALRAAFLAAQEGARSPRSTSSARSQLEYREIGKLAESGRME